MCGTLLGAPYAHPPHPMNLDDLFKILFTSSGPLPSIDWNDPAERESLFHQRNGRFNCEGWEIPLPPPIKEYLAGQTTLSVSEAEAIEVALTRYYRLPVGLHAYYDDDDTCKFLVWRQADYDQFRLERQRTASPDGSLPPPHPEA